MIRALRMAAINHAQMVRRIALAAVLFLLTALPAEAQLATAICSMSASGVNFGETSGEASTTTGTLVLRCTGNGNVTYTISLTTGVSGTYLLRQMENGPERLGYNLYGEASLGTIWGNGTGGSEVVAGRIQFQGQPVLIIAVPIHARLPVQPAPAPGRFQDTIVASLHYQANQVDTAFEVTANEAPSCAISATNLVFGDYTQAQLNGQSTINLACTRTTPWIVGLSQEPLPAQR